MQTTLELGSLQLKRCKHGWMLFNGPYIGKCLERYGEYSEGEVELIRAFVQPGHTVIDIGANIGALTLPISRTVGDAGRVYAIESHADTFNILCANLALNDIKNVKPINAFVEITPDADTSSAWGKHAFVSEKWSPPVVPLDSLDVESCQLIKIDTDGRERQIIQSGAKLIERCRPALYFENDVREASEALLRYVSELGYDMYWHVTPICSEENYLIDAHTHWNGIWPVSSMVIALPRECEVSISTLPKIDSPASWWRDYLPTR